MLVFSTKQGIILIYIRKMLGLHTYLLHLAAQQQHIITRPIIKTKTATTIPAIAPALKYVDLQFEFEHKENVEWQQSVAHS